MKSEESNQIQKIFQKIFPINILGQKISENIMENIKRYQNYTCNRNWITTITQKGLMKTAVTFRS